MLKPVYLSIVCAGLSLTHPARASIGAMPNPEPSIDHCIQLAIQMSQQNDNVAIDGSCPIINHNQVYLHVEPSRSGDGTFTVVANGFQMYEISPQ